MATTVIFIDPVKFDGTAAVIVDSVALNILEETVPNLTVLLYVEVLNPLPEMVIIVPATPDEGENDVIDGARIVKFELDSAF